MSNAIKAHALVRCVASSTLMVANALETPSVLASIASMAFAQGPPEEALAHVTMNAAEAFVIPNPEVGLVDDL
eukprot:CAMPEP_0178397058 /NCGR_PEP_ID=MMETSP0689_2-20121128/14049_1 /TAXON_ID=160604 /ORGANISM="Amphidinium massartii, Strain CS-259" /LENGTH=72 /DNA_ID=CAMNT_0020017753 /DNA_START=179 /DNA_END=397 /DNA_ORIENTATION=+